MLQVLLPLEISTYANFEQDGFIHLLVSTMHHLDLQENESLCKFPLHGFQSIFQCAETHRERAVQKVQRNYYV